MERVSGGGGRVFLSGEVSGDYKPKRQYLNKEQKRKIHNILESEGAQVKLQAINSLIAKKCDERSFFQLTSDQLRKIKMQWHRDSFVPEVPIGDLLWSLTQKEIAYEAVMKCCTFTETGERENPPRGSKRNEKIQLEITQLCKEKKESPFELAGNNMTNLMNRHFRTWCSREDFVAKSISIGLVGSAKKRCRESAPWSLEKKQIFYAAAIKCCKFDEKGRRKLGVTSFLDIQTEIDKQCERRRIPSFQPVGMAKFLRDHFSFKKEAKQFIGKEIFLRCCDPVDPSDSLREGGGEGIKRRKGPSVAEEAEAGGGDLAQPDSSIEVGSPLVVNDRDDGLLFLPEDEEDTLDAYIEGLLDRGISALAPCVRAEEPLEGWFPGQGVVHEGNVTKA